MVFKRLKQRIRFRSRKDSRSRRSGPEARPSVDQGTEARPSIDQGTEARPSIDQGAEARPSVDTATSSDLDESSSSKLPPVGGQLTYARQLGEPGLPNSENIRDLWNVAYKNLRIEEKELIEDYETKLCGDLSAGLGSILGSRASMRERMQAILEHKMQEINRNIWQFKSGSTEMPVRDLVQPVLGVVNWVNDYVTQAVSANPYASVAWAGVSLLLPLFLNPSEQDISLAKGLEYISSLIVQSRMWEDLYARPFESGTSRHKSSPESRTAYIDTLEKLYRQILKFQVTSYRYYARNTISRLAQDIVKWNEWDTLLDGVKDKESEFAKVRESWRDVKYDGECRVADDRHQEAMNQWQAIQTHFSGLREQLQGAEEEERRKGLLNWLCEVDPSEMYNAGRDKHEPGTCEWLVRDSQKFSTWEQVPRSLLWIHGKAGSGKSILSSSVIKHLQDRYTYNPGFAFAYFFFSFSDQKKQKVDAMLASLVKQLYASRPGTLQAVNDLGGYKEKGMRPDTEALEKALLVTASGFSSVSIVIDALDECPTLNGERHKLLGSLRRIIKKMPYNFHVFCTSRAEPDISTAMSTILSPPSGATINLTASQMGINKDIGIYVDSVFASADYKSWPGNLKAEAKNLLIEKSDGMFQYIFFQLETLRNLHSEPDIRTALQQLPPGLDVTYDRLLQSLYANYRIGTLNLLKWLAVSNEVLTLDQLAETLIIHTDSISVNTAERLFEPESCLKYLSSLVVAYESRYSRLKTTKVRLAHFSIKEYLMSDRIANGPAAHFSITDSDAHMHVAFSCLAYHLHRDSTIEGGVKAFELLADLPENRVWHPRAVIPRKWPIQKYAVKNWMRHLELVPREKWPVEVVNLATRALAARSRSLRTIIEGNGWKYGWTFGDDSGYETLIASNRIRRPQCVTAELGCLKLTEMLLCANAGTNSYLTRCDIYAALENATYGGHTAVIQSLLEKVACDNTKSDKLGRALAIAAYRGHADIANLLLDSNADFEAPHGKLGSALQVAAHYSHLHVVKLLVHRGADVNLAPNNAGSALTSAVPTRRYGTTASEILEFLLNNGANIKSQAGADGTALHKAARYLSEAREQFRLLLERGADVNAQGGEYGYPLQAACMCTELHLDDVKLLLDKGANVNAQGGKYGNALQAACYTGSAYGSWRYKDIVELLLDRGADINAQGGELGTALQAACYGNENIQLVVSLLEKGADLTLQGGKYGNALQAACAFGDLDNTRLLLDRGADVCALGGKYGTALQAAASSFPRHNYYRLELLELLLSRGAGVHQRGGCYDTVLQAACLSAGIDEVCLLLDHGADVNAEGGEYGTALQAACAKGNVDIACLLIEHGANIHLQGGGFGSAWHAAAHGGSINLLQLLIDHGADVNDTRGLKHPTALHAAFKSRRIDVISFLLSRGADVNINSEAGGSPLQLACTAEYEYSHQWVEFLLRKWPDIDVNTPGGIFGSALQTAVHSGNTSLVKLLLDKGAHINVRGGKYRSALNAAVFKGFWDVVEVLLERGAKSDRQQRLEVDEEWLTRVQEEWPTDELLEMEWPATVMEDDGGEEAVARYRVFWEKQPADEGIV